jgi:TP901 family phage tail tape measure protein
MDALHNVREGLVGNIAAMDQYRIRQGMVLNAQDAWQKKITDGKATFGDLIRNHKMLGSVMRDQIALQRSMGIGWTQSSKTGKFSVDQIIPSTLPATLKTARAEIGLLSNVVAVASDNMVKWGKNTQWAGRQLMVGFTVPMGIAAAATGKLAYDMDKALTQVVKVYGDANATFQESTDSIRTAAMETANAAARIYGQSAKDTLGIMADLAASGKSGQELQQATMSTTRAAILGELDWQDAVKATISMQEVYQASQTELANNWNYINAMENQTVLSAQDFVTAIPKVAGVMNALGSDLKATGALLAAFKAAGVDAAEGANALKSINFRLVATYGKGLETFKKKTGQDLRSMIDETNGETIPTLEKFAEAIKNLSAPDKVAVTRDVFGIYQGSKAMMVLDQITQKTDQWTQAMKVAQNTNLQNAAIAQQELDRQSERPFKQLDKAVETLKNNLFSIGEVFLGPAATLVSAIGGIVKGITEMNPAFKMLLGAGAVIVALSGPVIMLVGLMANLAANVMKGIANIGMLASGTKMLTVEQRMQQIVSNKMIGTWDAQTSATAALNLQLMHLAASLDKVTAASAAARGVSATPFAAHGPITQQQHNVQQARVDELMKNDPNNTPYRSKYNLNPMDNKYYGHGGTYAPTRVATEADKAGLKTHNEKIAALRAEKVAIVEQEHATRVAAATTEVNTARDLAATEAAQARAARVVRLGNSMAMAATAAGVLGLAMGKTEGTAGWITNALLTVGTLGMLLPGVMTKVAGLAVKMGSKIGGVFTRMGGSTTGFLTTLKAAGPILAAVGIAGIAVWQHFQNEIDAAREKAIAFNDYAKSMADVLGYSYTTSPQVDTTGKPKDGESSTLILAQKFRDTNAAAAEAFSESSGKSIGEKWGEAIAAGVDAKLHGATTEQAKDTARVAMQLMGKSFSDADWKAAIDLQVNFDDANSIFLAQMSHWKQVMTDAIAEGGINGWEQFFNSVELSQVAGEKVRKAGTDFWSNFINADKGEREDMLRQAAKQNDDVINKAYEEAMRKNPTLKNLGIKNATDFSKGLEEGFLGSGNLGLTEEQWQNLKMTNSAMIETSRAIAKAAGVAPEAREKLFRVFDLFTTGEVQNVLKDTGYRFGDLLGEFGKGIGTTVGLAKNITGVANAMDYFNSIAKEGSIDAETFNKHLQAMGYQAGVTLDAITNMYKNAYSGAQSSLIDKAMSQYDDMQQAAADAKEKELQGKIDKLDREAEAIGAEFDKKKDELDAAHDAQKKKFDKDWDARQKREETAYDNRIKAVEKQIEAEQKAEEIRQKIFEAEKTRIQRLAEMYSSNIDINMAINSGNLDEAAKLRSNAQATAEQWVYDDQMAGSGDASKKRVDALGAQKDSIEAAKKARMDALEELRKKQQEDLDQRIDNENKALKAQEDAAKKSVENRKKERQEQNRIDMDYFRKRQAADKRELEIELEQLRASLPMNKKQYEDQAKRLEAIFGGHLTTLTGDGQTWAAFTASELTRIFKNESRKLQSDINWAGIGNQIANDMLKGAFNMTADEFAKFINGGTPPKNSLFGSDPKPYVPKPVPRPKTPGYGGRLNDPNAGALHTGGVVSHGGGGRVGKSGDLKPSEVNKTLLVGEGVVNRKAMRLIGKTGLDNINSGGGMGGGGGKLGGGALPGMMTALSGKLLIQNAIKGAYDKAMGRTGNYLGAKSGVQGPGIAATVSNIAGAALATQPAYKSGHVVYLGHGSYHGGANLGQTARPAEGRVVSEFGPRNLLGMTFHNGIDIANSSGTPIKAAARARVVFTGWDDTGYGNYVQLQAPDGTMFGYGHNSTIGVRAGQQVTPGQIIARMGSTGKSTGPHSHFQTGRDGEWFNPRALFPQLKNGGFTLTEGLANLHPKETVVTAPLSEKFKQGVDNFANSSGNGYNVTMNFAGAHFETTADIEQAVLNVHYKLEKKRGVVRKVGQR